MRTVGTFLTLLILALNVSAAEESASVDRATLSENEKSKLREQLPHYDPTAASPVSPSLPSEKTNPATRRAAKVRAAETPAAATAPSPNTKTEEAKEKIVSLSPYIVRAKPLETGKLARPSAGRPQTDDKIDPFLSPAARQEAITKKYLSSFDRNFLNRWTLPLFGVSNFKRANALYEADVKAAELNKMADILEVPGENDSEKEKKEMRLLYERVLYEGRR